MNAPKWTPGPWESTKVNWDRCLIRHALPGPEHVPGYIAEVNNIGSSFPANTRLIAAAPELYDALEAMTLLASGPTGGVTQAQKVEIIARANAALAKARGDA